MLVFAAATQGWFVRRSRWYESALLLLVTFTLLRPGFWLDLGLDKYRTEPATSLMALAASAPPDSGLRLRIEGMSIEGQDVKKTVLLRLGNEGDAHQRIAQAGLTLSNTPAGVEVLSVRLRGAADRAGFEQGFRITGIEVDADRPAKEWLYLPALLLLGGIFLVQRARRDESPASPLPAAT
jgi:hypothetical protein